MSAVFEHQVLNFRPIEESDLDAVMAIEQRSYEFPWTVGIFRDCLRVDYQCCLLEDRGEVIAYGIMSVAAGECHILNLCVHSQQQSQGYGRMMLEYLLDVARRLNADTAFLEVRPSNTSAVTLYRHCEFDEVGSRRNYYPAKNGREDALIFARTLITDDD